MMPSPPLLPSRFVLGVILALTLVRLTVGALTGLVEDEAYYRLWSLAPAWGYYDHAPMVAWWIALGRLIGGDTSLGVRLLGPLSAGLGSLVLWRTAAVLFGTGHANRAIVWFNAMLLVGVGSVLMTPDIPSVFFWGLTLWALAELRQSENGWWWLAVGAAAGFGLLAKYSGLFLGAGIFLWLVIDRQNGRWFRHPALWLGGLLALCLFLPVFLWNAGHGWVSFIKQFGRAVAHSYSFSYLGEFLGGQWLLMTPLIGAFAMAGLVIGARAMVRRGNSPEAMLAATSLPFVLYLLGHSLHDRVQGNWPAPLMPALAMLAVCAADRAADLVGPWRARLTALSKPAAPLGFALAAFVFIEAVFPFLPIKPKANPLTQMRGWDALAVQIDAVRQANGAGWIATSSYALTGELAFALRDKADVIQLNERIRYTNLRQPEAVLVAQAALYIDRDGKGQDFIARAAACYDQAEQIGSVIRRDRGTLIETYVLYKLTGVRMASPMSGEAQEGGICL